jgi:hypothetical protein
MKTRKRRVGRPKQLPKRTVEEIEESIHLDPKKQAFLANYYDPESETYANGYRSALKAGYSEGYSKNLVTENPRWIKIGNYLNSTNMTPEHIVKSAEKLALMAHKDADKMKAIEFLAKTHGMLVEKKIVAHANIESFLDELDD